MVTTHTAMASSSSSKSKIKRLNPPKIVVDYNPGAIKHNKDDGHIHIIYDHREQPLEGSRFRSEKKYGQGTFAAKVKPPGGDASGLISALYLSSGEPKPGAPRMQDEIDFEFVGRNKTHVHTNLYVDGKSMGAKDIDLGFDSTKEYHDYKIELEREAIKWLVDDKVVREEVKQEGKPWPQKNMHIYVSQWNGGKYVDTKEWAGEYKGKKVPYVAKVKDLRVPK